MKKIFTQISFREDEAMLLRISETFEQPLISLSAQMIHKIIQIMILIFWADEDSINYVYMSLNMLMTLGMLSMVQSICIYDWISCDGKWPFHWHIFCTSGYSKFTTAHFEIWYLTRICNHMQGTLYKMYFKVILRFWLVHVDCPSC